MLVIFGDGRGEKEEDEDTGYIRVLYELQVHSRLGPAIFCGEGGSLEAECGLARPRWCFTAGGLTDPHSSVQMKILTFGKMVRTDPNRSSDVLGVSLDDPGGAQGGVLP